MSRSNPFVKAVIRAFIAVPGINLFLVLSVSPFWIGQESQESQESLVGQNCPVIESAASREKLLHGQHLDCS